MRRAFLAILALPLLLKAAENGNRVHYIGGTVAGISHNCETLIDVRHEDVLELRFGRNAGATSIRVPYLEIETVEYGLRVDRRYLEAVLISPVFLLAKRRTHYLTIEYMADGHRQAVVLQVDKADIRALLVSLEARTGKRIEYQDEDARRAGKG